MGRWANQALTICRMPNPSRCNHNLTTTYQAIHAIRDDSSHASRTLSRPQLYSVIPHVTLQGLSPEGINISGQNLFSKAILHPGSQVQCYATSESRVFF